MLPYSCSNMTEAYLFSYIVKCSLPRKVHVKYIILNTYLVTKSICLLIEELAQWLILVLRMQLPSYCHKLQLPMGRLSEPANALGITVYIWQKDLNKL